MRREYRNLYRLCRPLSYVMPEAALRWLHRHWKLASDDTEDWSFWLDVSYERYWRRSIER
jgi:hypothetical protein